VAVRIKIYWNLIGIGFTFAALVTITWALLFSMVSVENNFFGTGYVKIDLNHGVRVFDGSDLALAPGDSVTKPMLLINNSSDPVHYRIYLENVSGALQQALLFNIYDEDTLLKSVVPADFDSGNAIESSEPLAIDGVKVFYIEAVMNECAGNTYEGEALTFDVVAKAVQSKNNPYKEYQ